MTAKAPSPDELRMSGKEFDRIMRHALQVKPQGEPEVKGASKAAPKARKKKVHKEA